MSEAYSIEVAEEQIGIVMRQAGETLFRFHSAIRAYQALDGQCFAQPEAAERAARRHARARRLAV
jgi:hypothetical protein